MDKEKLIDALWENSNHGTMREDIVAAFEAGAKVERDECASLSPNGLDVSASDMPHIVWAKYQKGIKNRSATAD